MQLDILSSIFLHQEFTDFAKFSCACFKIQMYFKAHLNHSQKITWTYRNICFSQIQYQFNLKILKFVFNFKFPQMNIGIHLEN